MKKSLISVFAFMAVVLAFVLLRYNGANAEGEVLIVVHHGTTVVYEEYVSFAQGDTLFDVLNREVELTCANMNYKPTTDCIILYGGSPVILGINGVLTDWTNTYFAIYVNDEYSHRGVASIELIDGDVVRFEFEEVGGE